ncbi:hypothetical protein ACH4YO_25500 [Streptomyces noursei]|uniref:hypothetical protein n=1 Tax=Streptomyces noursei TaxID=1971 RepID=UPI0033CC0EEB
MNRIASLLTPLLRLLFPAGGRHRAAGQVHPAVASHGGARPAAVAPLRGRVQPLAPLRGEDVHLVRPYVLTAAEREQRRERREQWSRRGRRRVLWLAAHGVEFPPRGLRGMEVAA